MGWRPPRAHETHARFVPSQSDCLQVRPKGRGVFAADEEIQFDGVALVSVPADGQAADHGIVDALLARHAMNKLGHLPERVAFENLVSSPGSGWRKPVGSRTFTIAANLASPQAHCAVASSGATARA